MEFCKGDIVKDRDNGQEYYIVEVSERGQDTLLNGGSASRKRTLIQKGSRDTSKDTIRTVKFFVLKHTISGNKRVENGLRMNHHHWSKVNA